MTDITKSFGSVHALKGVNFELRAGEVMALAGENGAGKSTLVKMLSGIHRPDRGEIRVDGKLVEIHSSRRSAEVGVAVVQQELSVVPTMTVAENVFLGNTASGQVWSGRRLAARAAEFLTTVGLDHVDPQAPAGTLAVAEQQLVEVARMVARDARILILDEPTAALSDTEIERVKSVVRTLAAEGRSVIYVTHRLGEIFELANRVTVFRNGESTEALETASLDVDGLITKMLGRRLENMFPARVPGREYGETVLSVSDISASGLAERVSLEVRAGEIVGLAGQVGSGASPLLEAIAGARHSDSGTVALEGRRVRPSNQHAAIRAGIAYCSGDRKRDGMFGIRPVSENLTSASLTRVTPGGWLNRSRERQLGTEIAEAFDLRHRASRRPRVDAQRRQPAEDRRSGSGWESSRRSCSSTSRPAGSTSEHEPRSTGTSASSPTRGRPSCSPRPMPRRFWAWPTGWGRSTAAGWWPSGTPATSTTPS